MTPTLSVVLPVYNEAAQIGRTIDALAEALTRSGLDTEVVLVDDGSTDGTAAIAADAAADRIPLRIVTQTNQGRFKARRTGLQEATGEIVLLLDGRVTLAPDALRFVAEQVQNGAHIWTGHVDVAGDNPYAVFWRLIAELAWEEYFARPRTTQFDASNFDHFPKGTGCFVAPRSLLLAAIDSFRSGYSEIRYANDDTPLLRWIAEREAIHVSPQFSAEYVPRMRLETFVRHSFRRGLVFLDGHGRRESRFFPAAVAFFPASALLALASVRKPAVVPVAAAALSAGAAAFALNRRRSAVEVASLAALAPIYAAAHGAGMWRGLALIVRDRLRS